MPKVNLYPTGVKQFEVAESCFRMWEVGRPPPTLLLLPSFSRGSLFRKFGVFSRFYEDNPVGDDGPKTVLPDLRVLYNTLVLRVKSTLRKKISYRIRNVKIFSSVRSFLL